MILDERLVRYLVDTDWVRDTAFIDYVATRIPDMESYSRGDVSYHVRQRGAERRHSVNIRLIGLDVASVTVGEHDDIAGFAQVSAAVASCIDKYTIDRIAQLCREIGSIEKAGRSARWLFSEVAESFGDNLKAIK